MTHHRRHARLLLVASLLAGGLVASSDPAAADFHLMKVREVFGGTSADADAEFVELEMAAAGQGNINDQFLHIYDPQGFRISCHVPTDVGNQSQGDTILFGTTEFQALPDPDPDFLFVPAISADGGAACFGEVDCVAWGSFSGETTSPAGAPFPGGIPPGQSLERKGDGAMMDTDNSATDFSLQAPPDPKPNVPTPTPQGGVCVAGGTESIIAKPHVKVRGDRVLVTGRIRPLTPDGRVRLTLFANGSPLRKVDRKRDALDAESRFKKRFRLPEDSTRCKIEVGFQGRTVGKKRFSC
jgi:hypothetical protein